MEDFFLDIGYKNKTVRFKVVNPEAPLSTLMTNLRHAIGEDGKLIFDFPSIDDTGAPLRSDRGRAFSPRPRWSGAPPRSGRCRWDCGG